MLPIASPLCSDRCLAMMTGHTSHPHVASAHRSAVEPRGVLVPSQGHTNLWPSLSKLWLSGQINVIGHDRSPTIH